MPLRLPPNAPCSFCAHLSGDRPYTILERNDETAVLVTWEQRGLGHLLVIPVAHRVTIFELQPSEASTLMSATIRAAAAIRGAFDPEGVLIWQNNGISAHQSVPHVHFHVAGTIPGGRTIDGPVPRLTKHQTDEIADKLRRHLPNVGT